MRTLSTLSLITAVVALNACAAEKAPPALAPAPQKADFHAVDNMFHGPDTISAGMTTFTLTNGGTVLHHIQFVRLDSGKTMADLEAALKVKGPPPAWAVEVPGPNAPDPTKVSNLTMDMAAGNYAVVCFVDIPGGVPHFAKGMIKPLTVVASTAASAPAPVADVTIALSDYSFTLSKPLTAGAHTIEVTNSGPQVHEVEIIKFHPGKTMDDLGKWMAKPVGPPPAEAIGGVSGMRTGAKPTFTVDLTPGDYALVCFIPDAKDGKMHLEHGMIQMFKIQ